MLQLLTFSQEIYSCNQLDELCSRVKSISFKKPQKRKNAEDGEAEALEIAIAK
jgi:hypothetical protein